MMVDDLRWLWRMSAYICKHENPRNKASGFGAVRVLKRRLFYVAKSLRLISSLQVYIHPREGSPLQRIMMQRPELIGVTIWPYICSSWSAKTCLKRIDEHFRAIERMDSMLDFPVNETLPLLDLADVAANLQVLLDQPKWLMREGLFAINLFLLDKRIYSLEFSFSFEEGRVVAFIGGIQGVDVEGILDDYKDITKALHGMRPRDFLVEVFRIFCRCVGVTKIYAVNDAKRHLRSSYFGMEKSEKLFLNYNDIWLERGGMQVSEDFFFLSIETPMKNLDEVPSKKRAMYRRRYELLQSIEERIQENFKVHATVEKRTDISTIRYPGA
jgi:uncharacterized protein